VDAKLKGTMQPPQGAAFRRGRSNRPAQHRQAGGHLLSAQQILIRSKLLPGDAIKKI
jgi:hypothetical protein